MAAVLCGCQWWQKLHLRHEPGWASGGPTVETEEASVDWVPQLRAGSHMVPLWPTPLPFPQNLYEWGKGRRGGKWGEKEGGLCWKHEDKVKSVKQTNEWEEVPYPWPYRSKSQTQHWPCAFALAQSLKQIITAQPDRDSEREKVTQIIGTLRSIWLDNRLSERECISEAHLQEASRLCKDVCGFL